MTLPGVAGTLLPGRYLEGPIRDEFSDCDTDGPPPVRKLLDWWRMTAARCGPATGLRTIFDFVAMPLAAILGFRARHATFDRTRAHVTLVTPAGSVVALIVQPWAERRRTTWRDAVVTARSVGAGWCLVLAPPFLSLVDARGHASRRSLDFAFPSALSNDSVEIFWLLCRATSFDARIDLILKSASLFQDRVRGDLQNGVINALRSLESVLSPFDRQDDAHGHESLTIVYRILFLLFAESRQLVPTRHPVYGGSYSLGALCRDAATPGHATGIWEALAAITRLSRMGCRCDDLIVRPFNGRLFARAAAPTLERLRHSTRPTRRSASRDEALAHALTALGSRAARGGREEISFADLGVEQLGAVYERVLDRPRASSKTGHSAQRKQTGTFYTPQCLADFVVRRTLAPLVADATADRILAIRVVDPAMGSGAFLVAACRYLAGAYERALVDEGRCAETDLDETERADIRRLIAERCLAGVDVNPVAVQLARLSIWLTSLAHGKPLSFLDHRLRTGNSLIGVSPDDLMRTGGRKRSGAAPDLPLFGDAALEDTMRRLARPLSDLVGRRDDTVEIVREKEAIWDRLSGERSPLEPWRIASHLWCARWFARDSELSPAELRAAIDAVLRGDTTLARTQLDRWVVAARHAAFAHGFFHWPLEFPDVFYEETGRPRSDPGFDAVIGNPPWEMLRRDDGDRDRSSPQTLMRFVRECGLYPACDRGHVNLYQPFVERALAIARPGGRVGLVLPWGLAVDDGAATLREKLLCHAATDTIVGLDNGAGLFPIHRSLRFAVVTTTAGQPPREIRARFGVRTAVEIDALPARDDVLAGSSYPIRFSEPHLRTIGGAMRRIPDVRHEWSLALLDRLTRDFPTLGSSGGWNVRFGRELNATDDRAGFGNRGLPVVGGRHVTPFVLDATSPIAHMSEAEAARRLRGRPFDRPRLAYRDVSGAGNQLTLIAAIIPPGVVTTHTLFCLRDGIEIERQHFLSAVFNSFVINAVVRMLMGGHVTTSLVEGLPVPRWTGAAAERRIARLASRLERRRGGGRTNALLQALVARLYDLDARVFGDVLDSFPLVPLAARQAAHTTFVEYRRGRRA